MDFVKFFARDHDNLMVGLDFFTTDDRHTLVCQNDDFEVMMAAGHGTPDPLSESTTFAAVDDAAWAFRHKVDRLVAEGFVEVEKTIAASHGEDPPKAEWKRALDIIVIAVGADLPDQAELIEALAATPHRHEPQFVWARVARELEMGGPQDMGAAAAMLAEAEALIQSRLDTDTPIYGFMKIPRRLASEIARLRTLIALRCDDVDGALAAAKAECAWESSWEAVAIKLSLQFQSEGRERDAAFEELYENRDIPKLAPLTQVPGFADYAARRDGEQTTRRASGDAFEWSEAALPSSREEIAAAESALGVTLPEDYKGFLRDKGLSRMRVEYGDRTSAVVFLRAPQLLRERANFRRFTGMDLTIYDEVEGEVGLDDLLPIADCDIQSNSILLQRGKSGDRYFVWFHDSKCELYPIADSFAELIFRLQQGVPSGEPIVRSFFEFPSEDE